MAQDPFEAAWSQDPFDAAWDGQATATAPTPIGGEAMMQDFRAKPNLPRPSPRSPLPEPPPSPITETTRSVGRGAAQAGIGIAQGGLLAQEGLSRLTDSLWSRLLGYEVVGRYGGQEMAASLQGVKEDVLPARGERGFATHTAPEALGSALTFMLGGAATGGGAAGIAGLGAAAGFADGFYDATAHGATEEEAWTSAAANGGLGLTEAVPLGKFLARFNRGTGGALKQALIRMFTEGGEELAQEVIQGAGSNVVAKGLYDEERRVLEGLAEGGAAGFFVGALLSAASSGVARARASEGAVAAAPGGDATGPTPAPSVPTEPVQAAEAAPQVEPGWTVAAPIENPDYVPEVQGLPAEPEISATPEAVAGQEGVVEGEATAEQGPMSADNYYVTPLEEEAAPVTPETRDAQADAQTEQIAQGDDTAGPPATPKEAVGEVERTVSVMNRKMDEEMARLGLEPGTRAERTTEKAWDDEAKQILAEDPFAGQNLLDDLRAKPRAPTGTETAVLTREMVRMSLEQDKLNQEIIDAYEAGDTNRAEILEERAGKLLEAYGSAADVLAYAGSESGRSLRARQMTMVLDYSLVAMERAKRAANKGAPLTPEQRTEITELHKRITDLQEQMARAAAESDERVKLLEEQIDALIKGKAKERKRQARAKAQSSPVLDYLTKEADAARERLRKRGYQANALIDPTILVDIAIIGAEKIAKVTADFTAWSREMLSEFGDAIEPYLDEIHAKAKALERDARTRKAREKLSTAESPSDARAYVRKLAESLIESGVIERDALIDEVHSILKESHPETTRREAMDLISGYGDFTPLSKEQVKVRLRELRGEMQQLAKLDDMLTKGILPLATGREQAKLTDEARRLQQQVNETKKRLGLTPVKDQKAHLASAQDAIKTRLRHQIADIQHQLDTGKQTLTGRTKPPTDAEIEALRAERDALQKQYDAIFNPPVQEPGRKEVARLRAAEKATERAISDINAKIEFAQTGKPDKKPGLTSAKLDALRARRDALNQELADLRLAMTPQAEKDARALSAFKTRTANEMARIKERIAAGDYAPKPKRKPLALDAEGTRLKAEFEQAKQEYLQGLEDDRRRNMTPGQKAWMYGKEVFNIRRALFASFDLSALLRQGKWIVWSHPIESARAANVMLRSLASESYYQKVMAAVREQAHSGLYVAEVDAKLSAREEEIRSNLADKIPGMRGSNRAFTALLNVMRVKIHAQMTASVNAAPGSETAKYFAQYVNIATGRGEPGRFAATANAAAYFLWSPRLYLSRIQTLTGWQLWRPDKKVSLRDRRVVAKEYGRAVAGMIAYYTALSMFAQSVLADDDDEVEIGTNPLSSDFGKVRIGRVRIDPMAGMAQFAVLGARLVTGKKLTNKGEERSLTHYQVDGEDPVGYGQDDTDVVAGRFLRSKLNPTIGLALDLRKGANAIGQPIPSATEDPLDFAIWLMAPLSIQGAVEGVQELGWSRGVALGVFEALGDGVQIYAEGK